MLQAHLRAYKKMTESFAKAGKAGAATEVLYEPSEDGRGYRMLVSVATANLELEDDLVNFVKATVEAQVKREAYRAQAQKLDPVTEDELEGGF